jgi:hypothetical protein
MDQLFRIVSRITNPWNLAAFGIAAAVYIILKKRGKIPAFGWFCILAFVLGPILASTYLETFRVHSKDTSLYRVRVTVIGPDQVPTEEAKVWSSIGGEPKRVSAGWEFDIPAAVKPVDGKLGVFAAAANVSQFGSSEIVLADDYNPAVIIRLQNRAPASIRGRVIDDSGKGIGAATVKAVGYGTDIVTTGNDGEFVLQTHAPEGQQVLLTAEKEGYITVSQLHPAGSEPAAMILSRK